MISVISSLRPTNWQSLKDFDFSKLTFRFDIYRQPLLRGSTTFRTFFSKIEFFKKFLPPCNYPSWNKTNTINISVCRCLGNTASFNKGVQRYPHYKHHWVKIKTFGGSKLFFADTPNMDLGDKPQTCGFLSNWLCRKIKMWKNGVFCFVKKEYFGYCAKRKQRMWSVLGLLQREIAKLIFDT